ncbi:MAG: PilT/PilU family type 4a pilus ATPase [Lentisphaerae bacterium]|nr:PilT/PilU family type 4a pilus ATPase [Lentisphaerota bacterium]
MSLQKFFDAAVKFNATDLFLSSGKAPGFRVNGAISPAENIPPVPAEDITLFRKECLSAAAEESYCETGGADCSYICNQNRFRINFFESINGPCLVARPIKDGSSCSFSSLNLPEETMKKIASTQRGIIIVTGTTGSGKSTTMSAIINFINENMNKHILTLEDPIEFIHHDKRSLISQREVGTVKGGFNEALRNAMRENPDVIVIGEVRDPETVNTAVSAALTGHLVLCTMHTSDAASAVERMLEMFPEQQRETVAGSISVSLEAVIAQRLIPVIGNTGMIPAMDILIATGTIRKQIARQQFEELEQSMRMGSHFGMITFNNSLIELIRRNMISKENALKATDSPDELNMLMRGLSSDAPQMQNVYAGDAISKGQIDMRDLFKAAVKAGANDLLITVGVPPQLHINGQFAPLDLPPLAGADVQRLVYSLLNRRQRITLEEKRDLDLAMTIHLDNDLSRRFRLNAFFQRGNVALVGRLISETIPTPEMIGLPPVLSTLMQKKQGLILITGPTGSGKSTTLASLLDQVNHSDSRHVITIEDPIEYVYRHDRCVIEQREIGMDAVSFASGLRSAMRQAPDIIMVGELRDMETIRAAISAAETGHLVLGTLHSNNTCQTVERIIDSFPAGQQNQIRQQFAGCILAIVAQRLIPRIDVPGKRIGAFEVMVGNMAVRALIRDNKTHQLMSVIESSAKDGMLSMNACLNSYMEHGIISPEDRANFDSGN